MNFCNNVASPRVTQANTPARRSTRWTVRRECIVGIGKASHLHSCLDHEKGVSEDSLSDRKKMLL